MGMTQTTDRERMISEVIGTAVTAAVKVMISRGIISAEEGMVSLDPPGAPTIVDEDTAYDTELEDEPEDTADTEVEPQPVAVDTEKEADPDTEVEPQPDDSRQDIDTRQKEIEQFWALCGNLVEDSERIKVLRRQLPIGMGIDYECSLRGFFEYLGDEDAIQILRDNFGDEPHGDDPEALKDLVSAMEVLRETNRQRSLLHRRPLNVSSIMMAIAAVDAEAVLQTGDSPRAYNVSENIGAGDDEPLGWFKEEEERYLKRREGNVSRYTALVAKNRSVMGAAVIGNQQIYCQTFDWWASEQAYDGLRKGMMTVEDYSRKVEEFQQFMEIRQLEDHITKLYTVISELEEKLGIGD